MTLYLLKGPEVVLEVWHEVVLGVRGNGHANTAQVRSSIAGHGPGNLQCLVPSIVYVPY